MDVLHRLRRRKGLAALAGPTVLWFLAFLVVPLLIVVYYSFLSYSSFNVIHEFTLEGWRSGVFNDTSIRSFARTLGIGVVVTATTLVFGYPLAYFLRFYMSLKAGVLLLLFLIIPFWTSEVIRTIGWIPVLGRQGIVNTFLLWTGVVDEPLAWLLFSPASQMLGYLQNYVVFMAAPIYIALFQVEDDLMDASATLRGGRLATFRYVVWPLSLPGVAMGAIFVFVLSVGNFVIPQLLSGGTGTYTTLIYNSVNYGLNYPRAAASSVALLTAIFVVVYGVVRLVDITEIAEA